MNNHARTKAAIVEDGGSRHRNALCEALARGVVRNAAGWSACIGFSWAWK
jgi:hypothetical protein